MLRRYFETSLYLLLLSSVLALVSTGKLDLLTIVTAPLVLLVKGYRWWRGRGPELSQRAATRMVVAYFVFFPADLWVISRALAASAPSPGLYAALLATIHLMLFGMIVRLYSARTIRDYLFLAMLAFSTILAAAILTVDTTFLVFFFSFLVLAVSTFIGLEMWRSAQGAAALPLEAGTRAVRRLHRALGFTSASIAVSSLILGGVIFFIIPRFTAGYLGGYNLQPSLISGFADDVELGKIGEIKKNSAVVMRVRVEGGPERMRNVRWRGIALTAFDGKRWSGESHSYVQIPPHSDGWFIFDSEPRRGQGGAELRYSVLLEPLATDALFVAARAARIRGRFSATRAGYLDLDKADSIFNPSHNFTKVRYEAVSFVPTVPPQQLRGASTAYPDGVRDAYLQLPRLDSRIAPLARQITANAQTNYDKAAALESYLRTRLGYTLDLSGSPAADPLAHFLFERRAGHCEYFATAMTVMLRTLDIPARYVNGFLPGEYNEIGEDYIVRASDAHSWVEVYFPEYGWITFDPTPASDLATKGWFGRLAFYWDWFELAWSEWVINYDFIHQITLAQNLQRASRDWTERLRSYTAGLHRRSIDHLKSWQSRAVNAPYAWPAALAALLALALLRGHAIWNFLVNLWKLKLAPRSELTPQLATLQYEQMLRLLARRGLKKRAGQTPVEFARAIPAPELGAPLCQFTELYQRARFGARPAEAQPMAQLLGTIRQLLRSRSR